MGNGITLLIFHPSTVEFICGEQARQKEADKHADIECEQVDKKICHDWNLRWGIEFSRSGTAGREG
jgi:hypothetical protein